MALSTFSNLGSTHVVDLDLDASAELIAGSSPTLRALEIDNTQNSAKSYVKLYNASPTVGTTDPEMIVVVKAQSKRYFLVGPAGRVFATSLYAACLTTGGKAGTTSPTNPVSARFLL